MKNISIVLITFIGFALTQPSVAGPYTTTKDRACPDSWQITTTAIPVVWKSTGHSATSSYPYAVGSTSGDKTNVHSHINAANPIETIDGTPLTQIENQEDLLTIASECLTYRNYEVDTHDFVSPPAVAPNIATGWIPAAIF